MSIFSLIDLDDSAQFVRFRRQTYKSFNLQSREIHIQDGKKQQLALYEKMIAPLRT